MNLSLLFLLFILYSIIGWISEVVYCSIQERRFVNRGFLHGPLCPVYGFGALLVVFLLEPFAESVVLLFFSAMVITTTLEYMTAWLLETAFSTRWWDYSDLPFNFRGRVCLLNSVLFAFMALVGVRVLHPGIESFLLSLPESLTESAAGILAGLLFIDLIYTLRTLVRFEEKLASLSVFLETVSGAKGVRELFRGKDLREMLRNMRTLLETENTAFNRYLAARLESLLERTRGMQRLLRAFPTVQNRTHTVSLGLFRLLQENFHQNGHTMNRTRGFHLFAVAIVLGLVILLGTVVFIR